jgi:3-hydroxyacyl-CoA dehydrogenase
MASASGREHRVIGMHFFSPAHVMKLVEIIPGDATDQDTIDTVEQFAQELRKIPVIVKECPGFLVNRLLTPYLIEATLALEEGAATAPEIDEAMGRGGFGWPMGPFILIDMMGLDVSAHVADYLLPYFGARVKPAKLFSKLLDAGRLGEKAGVGFYNYGKTDATPLEALIEEVQRAEDVDVGTRFSPERLIMPFLNEAALCVEEEIANVNDIDMACIAGLGMAINKDGESVRMGPLEYMDELGLDVVVAQMEELAEEFGTRFQPVDILLQKVRAGNLGKKTGYGFKEYTT